MTLHDHQVQTDLNGGCIVIRLRRRPFLQRLARHYRAYRQYLGPWTALREAWRLARL